MSDQIVIDRGFAGPPNSANGGYACGVVAKRLSADSAAEVTLRAPPPLDHPLTLEEVDGLARLLDGRALVAEGRPASAPELAVPAPVSIEDAARAREGSPMQREHPYPSCFVCSPERARGDGLGVVCGPVPGREEELVAAPFEVTDSLGDAEGHVPEEIVWAVLDCPGGIAAMLVPDFGKSMLGRMSAAIRAPLQADRDYVAVGWPIRRDGRKLSAGSAIVDGDGRALAVAEALWIELRDQPP